MYKMKENKAITLVALVITIIVMLILAGVAISVLTGDGRLFDKTLSAANTYNEAVNKEAEILQNFTNDIDTYLNNVTEDMVDDSQGILNSKVLDYDFRNTLGTVSKKIYSQLTDATGNNNDATLYNVDTTDDGKGLIFKNSSSYAQITQQSELQFPLTIETTISTTNSTTQLQHIYANANLNVGISINNSAKDFVLSGSTTNTYNIPTDFFDGNLKHLVITYNSTTDLEFYINGVKQEKSTVTNYLALGSSVYLGRRSTGYYFNGTIYNFRMYNKILSNSEIESVYNSSKNFIENNITEIKNPSLVLDYFAENSNNVVKEEVPVKINDLSKNNNVATVFNTSYNKNRNALVFNGSTSYAEIDQQSELQFPLTLETTISTTNTTALMEHVYANADLGIAIVIHNESEYFLFSSSNTNTYNLPSDFCNGEIKHLVVTYNSTTDFNFYINGVKQEKIAFTNYLELGSSIYLGKRSNNGWYFDGTIYNFRIYNKILSDSEILSLYQENF